MKINKTCSLYHCSRTMVHGKFNFMLKRFLYVFQLEGYDVERFNKWIAENKKKEIIPTNQKIKWTLKARILYFISLLINFLLLGKNPSKALIFSYFLISWPEKILKSLIILKARYKISQRKDLIVIGITGSYGKTSVKEILTHLLSVKYKVLKTPDSYNTPLGISKIINGQLKQEYEVFVVEMGAYKKGDIKNLCYLAKPKLGVITSIGKQHLERFVSENNILETKFELADYLVSRGKVFLNINDPKIASYSQKYDLENIIYYGVCENCFTCKLNQNIKCNNFLKVKNIKVTNEGTHFVIKHRGGKETPIKTKLLGRHNIQNIMAGINIALYLGVSFKDIEKQCLSLEPIPHRLQLLKGANDTSIIDDSFNANPDSAKAALEVLRDFEALKKIIITPGLVELGEKQKEENQKFGEEMAKVADYILVVGETNRKALQEGINRKGTNSKFYLVRDIKEATEKLAQILIPNSVILFENDLPAQYK